ncbi:hypothetical protein [Commensalibacter papalotli (ex Servin-Garciduenas et al. 2014)]|uniref:DUF2628 domain-containing protein n=1 Tax=Commensalibacter papalotli (ex Servin-Garciduenas et al. 2014) TaxID=1208583 RepID=W7DTQ7_9PROT|nr:hypothetical protein [Commensalibacter papalotli (ex Servin-Garciduenas et al. 2014)]EUK18355.1 hypothetical protein COMX_01365 [Commensalibacter papalotli (ex Servin-Garciduenas et al. 2014)]
MKFFTVYTNPQHPKTVKLVPNGFSWLVFVLGAIGLFIQKSWIHGLIIFSLCISIRFWLSPSIAILILIHFLLACFAYQFQRAELTLSGWKIKTIVAGRNKEAALLRLCDQYPDLSQKI